MLRKFNYTGRKKINRSAIGIALHSDGNRPPSFDATKIHLDGLDLPEHAHVYVEAYHKASYMRFDLGRVGHISVPPDRRLTEIDGGASALFRVKVIDETTEHGRVLAEVDGLSPIDGQEVPANRIPLLPVVTKDLGHAVWMLDFSDGRPVLLLSRHIESISQLARNVDQFFALVYPMVVHQVLRHILRDEEYYNVDDPIDDWRTQWLLFVCQMPGIGPPPKPQEGESVEDDSVRNRHLEWIEGVVMAFCAYNKVRDRFSRAYSSEND